MIAVLCLARAGRVGIRRAHRRRAGGRPPARGGGRGRGAVRPAGALRPAGRGCEHGRDRARRARGVAVRRARRRPAGHPQGPDVVRLASLLEWLVLAAAALALLVAAAARTAVGAGVRGPGGGAGGARPAQGGRRATTPRSSSGYAVQPATAGDQLPAGSAGRSASPALAGTAPATLSPRAAPEHRAALPGLRRARQRDPHRGALLGALAARDLGPARLLLVLLHAWARAPSPRSFQALGLLGVELPAAGHPRRRRSRGCAPSTRAPTRGSTATRPRCRGRSWWIARSCGRDADAQLAAVTAGGFPARAAAVTERRLAGPAPRAPSARRPAGQRAHRRLRRRAT